MPRGYCNPICVQCGRVMDCAKNSFVIAYPGGRAAFLDGDRFECKHCGTSIVSGISSQKQCGFRMSDQEYNRLLALAMDPATGIVLVDDGWPAGEWPPAPLTVNSDRVRPEDEL